MSMSFFRILLFSQLRLILLCLLLCRTRSHNTVCKSTHLIEGFWYSKGIKIHVGQESAVLEIGNCPIARHGCNLLGGGGGEQAVALC